MTLSGRVTSLYLALAAAAAAVLLSFRTSAGINSVG